MFITLDGYKHVNANEVVEIAEINGYDLISNPSLNPMKVICILRPQMERYLY